MDDSKIVLAYRQPEKQEIARQMRRVMTPAEALLWSKLRNNQLDGLHFRRQQVVDGFIADFYCRAARLVIECDGAVHLSQLDYDQERDRILSAHNLRILRFSNTRIQNELSNVLAEIHAAAQTYLAQRASSDFTLP